MVFRFKRFHLGFCQNFVLERSSVVVLSFQFREDKSSGRRCWRENKLIPRSLLQLIAVHWQASARLVVLDACSLCGLICQKAWRYWYTVVFFCYCGEREKNVLIFRNKVVPLYLQTRHPGTGLDYFAKFLSLFWNFMRNCRETSRCSGGGPGRSKNELFLPYEGTPPEPLYCMAITFGGNVMPMLAKKYLFLKLSLGRFLFNTTCELFLTFCDES